MENMENELKEIEEIEEKEIITEEDIDESDPENKKYDESRIYYVYEHIRLDKMEPFYIGKGKGERAYELYRNDHHDAITDEYGHAVVIIADNLTEEEAYWLERDTIEDYVFNLGNGIDIKGHDDYDHALPHLTNRNWGGIGVTSGVQQSEETRRKRSESMKGKNKGKKLSDEARKNMSEAHKGKKKSEETKRKMGESRKGEKNGMYGKHHSKEAIEKMSEAKKGKPAPRRRSVICITTGKKFNSLKDASDYYDVATSGISFCCKGKYKHAGELNGVRLQWKYLEDDDNDLKAV